MFRVSGSVNRALRRVLGFAGSRLIALSERVSAFSAAVRVLEREDKWLTVQVDDIIWRLDRTHYIDGEILRYGVFEPHSTRWMRKLVKPGMIVADVGANFGYYTIQLSRIVGPRGHVYSFEPSAHFLPRLKDHVKRNDCSNVTILEYALSDQMIETFLFGGSDSATMHWPGETSQASFREAVKPKTLDAYSGEIGLERLDFVKVDIDGNETRFVNGAVDTLQRFRPIVLMEFSHLHLLTAGSGVEVLAKQLTDIGYSLYSEKTGELYSSRVDFLSDAMNCTYSTNIICHPGTRVRNLSELTQ